MCSRFSLFSKNVLKSRRPTRVLGSVFHITGSGENAAFFRNAQQGEESKQANEKTHLTCNKLRNKFKEVLFSLSIMAGILSLTLHFLTFKNVCHDEEVTSQVVDFTLCSRLIGFFSSIDE